MNESFSASLTWSVKMIGAFAVLIVVDAVGLVGIERQVDVLAVEMRAGVGILRVNVLQELIDADVGRKILRVGPEDVEQLLVNRMGRVVGELVLAGVGVEEAGAGRQLRPHTIAEVVQVIFIDVMTRRNEHVIVKVVLLVVFIELLMRLFLRNFRRFAIDGRVEWHFDFMIL